MSLKSTVVIYLKKKKGKPELPCMQQAREEGVMGFAQVMKSRDGRLGRRFSG